MDNAVVTAVLLAGEKNQRDHADSPRCKTGTPGKHSIRDPTWSASAKRDRDSTHRRDGQCARQNEKAHESRRVVGQRS